MTGDANQQPFRSIAVEEARKKVEDGSRASGGLRTHRSINNAEIRTPDQCPLTPGIIWSGPFPLIGQGVGDRVYVISRREPCLELDLDSENLEVFEV